MQIHLKRWISRGLSLLILLVVVYKFALWHGSKKKEQITNKKVVGLNEPAQSFQDLPLNSDGSQMIWKNAWSAESKDKAVVGIATQCSPGHLNNLLQTVEMWSGPVSLAVFSSGDTLQSSLHAILTLIKCNHKVASAVSFHIVIPTSHPPYPRQLSHHVAAASSMPVKCIGETLGEVNQNYGDSQIPYPVNTLRNVALDGLSTSHALVLDIDIMPNPNLVEDLLISDLLSLRNRALVLPAFEIQHFKTNLPKDKQELLKLWEQGEVRPFYYELCPQCQELSDYTRWKDLPLVKSRPYLVEWKGRYEPFYIASRKDIHYDERFVQYGYNRRSQLCNLHMRGYDFQVLPDAFVIHLGFKIPSSFHMSKDTENKRNAILYKQYKEELLQQYGQTGRQCS